MKQQNCFASLPQAGKSCIYELTCSGIRATHHLSVMSTLGEVIGFPVVGLSKDQTLVQRKNKWFIKSDHLFTWRELEEIGGPQNMCYKLLNEARVTKRHLMEYHKDAILKAVWDNIQR